MSSSATGLGGWKKGGRVSDASAVTQNIRVVAQGQADATYAGTQKKNPFRMSQAILNGGAYDGQNLSRANLVSRSISVSAIPNLSNAAVTLPSYQEPYTTIAIVSNAPYPFMNGAYYPKASTVSGQNVSGYGPHKAFKQLPFEHGGSFGWISRFGYQGDGSYGGYRNTTTIVQGQSISGEYLEIRAPYSFVLSSYDVVAGNDNGDGYKIPASWKLVAAKYNPMSNSYVLLDTQTDVVPYAYAGGFPGGKYSVALPGNRASYDVYRMIVTKTNGSINPDIDSLNLYTTLKTNPP